MTVSRPIDARSPGAKSNYVNYVTGTYANELMLAIELALRAGRRAQGIRSTAHRDSKSVDSWQKKDGDIVTEADIAAEKIIISGIKGRFPDDDILSEESGMTRSDNTSNPLSSNPLSPHKLWVIDPIDGTNDFSKGYEGYSVMIGILCEGSPVMGVVFQPEWHRCYWASKDSGSWLLSEDEDGNDRIEQLSTRETRSGDHADGKLRLTSSRSNRNPILTNMISKLDIKQDTQIGSVGVKAGIVANNEADVYITDSNCHYWDTVAPQIILEAAGGVFTFLDGTPITYPLSSTPRHNLGLLATNGQATHASILDQLG